MNARIYKNEFDPAYINYLKVNYKVESETEKVLELTGIDEQVEDAIHEAMFKSYDQLCGLYPEIFTHFEDEVARFCEELHELYYGTIIKRQIQLQQTPAWEGHIWDTDAGKAAYEKYSAISNLLNVIAYLTK